MADNNADEPELPPFPEEDDADRIREVAFAAEAAAIHCQSAWGKAQLLGVAASLFAALDELGNDFVLIEETGEEGG